MKKTICLLLVLCVLLCGCGAKTESETAGYTFTDDLGRTVTVTSHERTAALLGSYADIWMLAGGTVVATADDAWDDFQLPLGEDAVNLGATKHLSLELLLAADPDFVIASSKTSQHVEWKDTLEAAGITVAYFEVNTFDDYMRMLKICTDLTGRADLYEQYGTSIEPVVAQTLEHSAKRVEEQGAQSVLVLRASATFILAKNSKGTVLGEMLHDLGCTNIADSDAGLLENLSVESILAMDPDRIFIVQSGDDTEGTKANVEAMFRDDPAWQGLTAMQEGKVHYVDKQLYNLKPNARWGEAYEKLEEILSN